MEPEGSLPHSQVPTTCPYPEPARSSPYPHISLPARSILILSSHLLNSKLNSVALVRERTIPTERPPPVGEVSANYAWVKSSSVYFKFLFGSLMVVLPKHAASYGRQCVAVLDGMSVRLSALSLIFITFYQNERYGIYLCVRRWVTSHRLIWNRANWLVP